MSADGSRQRPYKVWSSDRTIRKGITASNFQELVNKGKIKLALQDSDVSIVLESDGTEIDDDRYFHTLEDNTVFVFLRTGERWYPPGVEAIRAGQDELDGTSADKTLSLLMDLLHNPLTIVTLTNDELQNISNLNLDGVEQEWKDDFKRIQELCSRKLMDCQNVQESMELLQLLQKAPNPNEHLYKLRPRIKRRRYN